MTTPTLEANTGRLIYAASCTSPNLLYESGFNAADPFLWFQTPQITGVVVNPLEYGRALKECPAGVTVIDQSTYPKELKLAQRIQHISQESGITHWMVPADFPLFLADALRELQLTLTIQQPFSPARRVKSPKEIAAIRHAQKMAEAGLVAADAILKESQIQADGTLQHQGAVVTTEMLRGAINCEITRLGGCALDTIVAPGPQGADPHQCGYGPIHAGEPIVMDIFPRDQKSGYYGDLTRTRVKGTAAPHILHAYQTVLNAQLQALDMLKAGLPAEKPHLAVQEAFQDAGYVTGKDESGRWQGYFHSLGHSVGLEIHEEPRLSINCPQPLETGNVVTVEPGLYYPKWGGIRIEDTVAITDVGIDNLTTAGKFLEIP